VNFKNFQSGVPYDLFLSFG